ncbi:MAG: aldo/keto reductase [bacterium]
MTYGRLDGVDKRISRLVMGTTIDLDQPSVCELYDDFFRNGGNCFDTAHVYCRGRTERRLGEWISSRNVRANVVLVVKGAHPPHCNPKMLVKQFEESLSRLHTDYADIYFLHRDNTDIPVSEFVDALAGLKARGMLRSYGGSNWTPDRFDEANAYAQSKGLMPFVAVSNNFSLARMVTPVWTGCLSSSGPAFLKWHIDRQVPCFAWSSQARGFFFKALSARQDHEDEELARCWYSEDNFRRLLRCKELALKKDVQASTIALAYVLCQPFPAWAIIGPSSPERCMPSYAALKIRLTDDEMKWLNLEQ